MSTCVFKDEPNYITDLREKLRTTKSKLHINAESLNGKTDIAFRNCAKFLPDKCGEYTLSYGLCLWGPYENKAFGTCIMSKNLIVFVTNDSEYVKVVIWISENGYLSHTYVNDKLTNVTRVQHDTESRKITYIYTIEHNKIVAFEHILKDVFQIKIEWKGAGCHVHAPLRGDGYAAAIINGLKTNELPFSAIAIEYKAAETDKPGDSLKYFCSGSDITDPKVCHNLLFIKPKQGYVYLINPSEIKEYNSSTNVTEREIHLNKTAVIYEKRIGLNIIREKYINEDKIIVKITYFNTWDTIYTFNKSQLECIEVSDEVVTDKGLCHHKYKINKVGERKVSITGDTPNVKYINIAMGFETLDTEMAHFEYL